MTEPTGESSNNWSSDGERLACCLARLLADSRCEDVVVMDVRRHCQVTDFFVLASGSSPRQIRSVVDDLKELAESIDESVYRSDGIDHSQWVVMDFVNVVAHVFMPEQRLFYDLESLWGDGLRVDWTSRTYPGQFSRIGVQQRPDAPESQD